MEARYRPASVAQLVRERIDSLSEGVWRFEDFDDLPLVPAAQALSRMVRAGDLERLGRGTYYRPRRTALGKSRPHPEQLDRIAQRNATLFPAGLAAAHHLGFTTQSPARREVSTTGASIPRALIGPDTILHTNRPMAWMGLGTDEGALLEFLRDGGCHSELPGDETLARTIQLLGVSGRFERLLRVAPTEPPRVRAMLGALGEIQGATLESLAELKQSLNPLSRFAFGAFRTLPNAHRWQSRTERA